MEKRTWMRGALAALVALAAMAYPLIEFAADVPFVPTPQVVVDEMLRVAAVGPQDVVYDLGSGDGRVVITAAKKFGARGVGVELDDHLVIQSEEAARQAGVEQRVKFLHQDLFKTDLSEASVITMYLLPAVNRRLRPQLLDLRPGTRIVAHDFDLDDWKPDQTTTVRKNVFLWVVPAKVAGRWHARVPLAGSVRNFVIDFRQTFQMIDGIVRVDKQPAQMWEARLRGDRISFVIVDGEDRENEASLYFEGRVSGNAMDGTITRGVGSARSTIKWKAMRIGGRWD
jgi:SAM-dependent methyltransferase